MSNKKDKIKITNNEKMLVMMEELRDSIQLLAEGQIASEERLTRNINEFKDEMYSFRDEMHSFRGDMYKFKDEMYEFKNEMYSFKSDMYKFKDEMYSFRDGVYSFEKQAGRDFKAISKYQIVDYEYAEKNYDKIYEEFQKLNKQISAIEMMSRKEKKKNVKIEEEIKKIKKDIRANKKETVNRAVKFYFSTLEKRVEKIEKKIKIGAR